MSHTPARTEPTPRPWGVDVTSPGGRPLPEDAEPAVRALLAAWSGCDPEAVDVLDWDSENGIAWANTPIPVSLVEELRAEYRQLREDDATEEGPGSGVGARVEVEWDGWTLGVEVSDPVAEWD